MCGRFSLTASPEEVQALFELEGIEAFPERYNIAPTQPVLMISSNLAGVREPLLVRWGFVPAWAKDPKEFTLIINARSETAAQKASFRNAMRHRRSLMPASGFYEWYRKGEKKQPYWVRPRDGGVVAFGSLVETWASAEGSEFDSGCVLTTTANKLLAPIHHRMPVVIHPENIDEWLNCATQEPKDVAHLMQPIDDDFFEAIPVGDAVNKVANASPEIQSRVEPVVAQKTVQKPKPDDGQMDLF